MNHNGRGFWDTPVVLSSSAQRFHTSAAITSPYDGNPLAISLFVFCYNHESSIEATLNTIVEAMRVIGISYEIIIIDDGSRDRSVELLRRFVEAHSAINIVLRLNKESKGLAQNYADAAFIGHGKYYRLISADNSELMETLVDVLKATGEADIVVPYYVASMQEGGGRQLMAQGYARLFNLVSGNRINDYSASPVHLRFNVMRWHSGGQGFSFEADLLCLLLDLGFTCKQVPCRTLRRRVVLWKDVISLPHTLLGILLRRLGKWMD